MTSKEALKNLIDLIDEVSLSTLTRGQKRDVEKNRKIIEKDLDIIEDLTKFYSIAPYEIRTAIIFYLQAYKDFMAGNFILKDKGEKLKW